MACLQQLGTDVDKRRRAKHNGAMTNRSCLSAFVLVLSCVSLAQQTTAHAPLDSEEYKVMASAIDGYRQARVALHPIVADRTSTFECGSVCNGMVMGGCNGLRGKDETPADRLAIVKRDLPELEKTTLIRFQALRTNTAPGLKNRFLQSHPTSYSAQTTRRNYRQVGSTRTISSSLALPSMRSRLRRSFKSASCQAQTPMIAGESTSCLRNRVANGWQRGVPMCGS